MFRVSQRWFLTLMALLTFAVGGCGGGGNGGTDDLGNPVDPFVPNLPGSGSGAVSAPRNVSGEALDRSIRVTWDPVAGADGYYVYTSTDGSTFVRQNLALYTTTSILLTGLENERTYFVGVSAVRGNRESDTAYAGGGPGRMPLVPRAEPLPEPPETVIEEITVWQDAEVPDSVTNPPDDRRILVTWHTLSAADVDRFLVEFFVANRLGNGSLSQPDPGNLIPIGNPQVVRPGDLAMLQDLDFFRDPAAPQ
ncbi:MAG TPA: fibronectin type III domain-containing protein, partial [bacterium]|nr:fibronectin type III domain-containing protein [bacterium]